jgi:hypothetical protein
MSIVVDDRYGKFEKESNEVDARKLASWVPGLPTLEVIKEGYR